MKLKISSSTDINEAADLMAVITPRIQEIKELLHSMRDLPGADDEAIRYALNGLDDVEHDLSVIEYLSESEIDGMRLSTYEDINRGE